MVQTVKNFYNKHTIRRAFLTIVALVILLFVLVSIPVWMISEEKIAATTSTAAQEGEEIALDAGTVVVAQNGGKILSVNTATMVITVTDDETGYTFSSAASGDSGSDMALISLTYLGEDNNLTEWNSYDYSVAFESYSIYQIENGVRFDINLNEGESNRFYEYLPKKMSIETYEEQFVGGIEALMESGELDETTGNRYLTTLSLVYNKSLTEECYAVTYTGNPPTSATNQLIAVAALVEYTTDQLLEDADTFGFTVTFTEPAEFDLVVEITLNEDGELTAHMPTGSIVSYNDYYVAQSVALLPNFGAVTAAEYESGYVLVPDGSGALMDFNSYVANVSDYKRPFYDSDYYSDYYYASEYGEELFMPVFGMVYGETDASQKGFLAIIEDSARTAYMNVKLASTDADSSKYNKAYASFEVDQYKKVKIYGEYSTETGTYLVDTGMQDLDLTIRYILYGEGVTYFDMAKGYQAYLEETEGLTASYDEGEASLYLELVGGLNIASRIVGIPYSKAYSMTTYENVLTIMEALSGVNYDIQYDGAFNGGWNGNLNNGASLASQNGTKSQLQTLMSTAEDEDVTLYLQVALTQIWQTFGNGFRTSRDAIRDFSNTAVELSRYNLALGVLNTAMSDGVSHDSYYLLSPRYLSAVTDNFLDDAEAYGNLAITDLANLYYADYRENDFITGEQGDTVLTENLEKLSEEKTLALTNPQIDKIGYGSVATDVSRESSDYSTFAVTIPFKQLVMNGLIDYTTEDVNLSSRNSAYFVLQCAELGSSPKFILTWENVDVLKDTDFSYLYSTQFSIWEETIKEVYEECASIREQIGTSEITGHQVLDDGVYETTYANGVVVTVNYNLYDVTLSDESTLAAESYLIKEGN
ncbi:MAG: DUF5696 domain-containing protein [Clostridiales bacterium]|nr:DUF5696 domain-containing protein [Clostridiales bacterium]